MTETKPKTHVIHGVYVIKNALEFVQEFEKLMTPNAVVVSSGHLPIMEDISMAYLHDTQLPIPSDSSAEAMLADIISHAADATSGIAFSAPHQFVGSESIRDEFGTMFGSKNPFMMLEKDNAYGIQVYKFIESELDDFTDADGIVKSIDPSLAVVITVSRLAKV